MGEYRPHSFSYGSLRPVLPERPRAIFSQYGPRARLIRSTKLWKRTLDGLTNTEDPRPPLPSLTNKCITLTKNIASSVDPLRDYYLSSYCTFKITYPLMKNHSVPV